MKVLVACEFSGIVRDAFKARGHDARSCDLLPTENPGQHIQDDVLKHLDDGWDLMVGHPDCRYLTNSGVRWLFNYKGKSLASWEIFGLTGYVGKNYQKVDIQRFIEMHKAADFFSKLLLTDIPKIALENPIQHEYAYQSILMRMPFEKIRYAQYDQIVHPWQYGHSEKNQRVCG